MSLSMRGDDSQNQEPPRAADMEKKKKKKERKKERRKEGKMKPGSHFFPFLKLSRVLVTVLSIAKKLVLSPF